MKITIPRCYKPPGLIIRAKTYYLELNDKGLYAIALGNATAQPVTRSAIQQAVADAAVAYFDQRYEKEIVANETRIMQGQLDQLAAEKRSYFLPKNEIVSFVVSPFGYDFRLRIKGGKANLNLIVAGPYSEQLQKMAQLINGLRN